MSENYAEKIREIEVAGYMHLPGMLTPEEVAQLKAGLDKAVEYTTVDYSDKNAGHKNIHWSCDDQTVRYIAHERIIGFLTALFGDEIICTSTNYTRAQPGHPGIAIHTDSQPYGSKIFGMQASSPVLVRVLIYLSDQDEKTSPLRVIPYSHLSLHSDANPYNRYESHPDEIELSCKAGDVVVINQKIFHGNGPNVGTNERFMFAVAYRPAWAGPIADVEDWNPEDVARLPDGVRQLFGSMNTKKINWDVANRPDNMATGAPGLNISRWDQTGDVGSVIKFDAAE